MDSREKEIREKYAWHSKGEPCKCDGCYQVSLIDNLRAERDEIRDRYYQDILDARGVKTACKKCNGLGVRMYGDSSTWHKGGMAGQVLTHDVCDVCWGSGDANRHGADLRKLAELIGKEKS